jgi:predicted RNase H-like nuclease (RuvC/YqgF family)
MKPTQVTNSRNYRLRQRQKIEDLTHRIEALENETRSLQSQVEELRAENARGRDEMARMRAGMAQWRAEVYPFMGVPHNDIIRDRNEAVARADRLEELLLQERAKNVSNQLTEDMWRLIRLKCSPDKLHTSPPEVVDLSTKLIQVVNQELDKYKK